MIVYYCLWILTAMIFYANRRNERRKKILLLCIETYLWYSIYGWQAHAHSVSKKIYCFSNSISIQRRAVKKMLIDRGVWMAITLAHTGHNINVFYSSCIPLKSARRAFAIWYNVPHEQINTITQPTSEPIN